MPSPPPCGWPNSSAAKRSPFPAARQPKNCCGMRRPTMSRTSSSAPRKQPTWCEWLRPSTASPAHPQGRRHQRSRHFRRATRTDPPRARRGTAAVCRPHSIFAPICWRRVYVAVALCVGIVLDQVLDVRNLALVFLMAVLTSAVLHGLRPALYSCVLGALAFNFFFLPPRYTLTISDPESVACALLLPRRGSHRQQSDGDRAAPGRRRQAARAHHRGPLSLFQKLAGTGTLDDVLWATAFQLASMLKVRVVLLAAGGWHHRRQGRLSSGRYARRRRYRRRALGLGAQSRSRPRRRHASRRQAPLRAAAHRAQPPWA